MAKPYIIPRFKLGSENMEEKHLDLFLIDYKFKYTYVFHYFF